VPQGTPGTPSGTYGFSQSFSNAEILFEALSRCQVRGTAVQQHHMTDGRRSINLALQSWTNRGLNLFQLEQNVIQLVANQATYQVPFEVVSIADAYYNIITSTGAGPAYDFPSYDPSQPTVANDPQIVITQSSDRWLRPFGHADYARLPNKTSPGTPTSYWFNRIGPPAPTAITFWQPPSVGYPQAAVTYFAVRMIQDANLQNGEAADVVARFLDALCADVAHRMARKYAPQLIGAPGAGGLLDERNDAIQIAMGEDTEKSEVKVMPDIGRYYRM